MGRSWLAALVVILSTGCCARLGAPASPAQMTESVADLERKTVAILGDENRVICSGVWVSDDEILTANHCVDDADIGDPIAYVVRGDVSAPDEDELEAIRVSRLADRDFLHDLALLRVKLAPEHSNAKVIEGEPIVGEFDQTMGHPMRAVWSYSTGVVAALRVTEGAGEVGAMWFVQSTAPISPGNSGGGLFNARGELMGICHASIVGRAQNVNFYIDSQYIRRFLART